MTALQKIDAWLDDIKKDLEGKGVAGYAGQFVYDKLKEVQADMQTEALKNSPIPPHPLQFHAEHHNLDSFIDTIRDAMEKGCTNFHASYVLDELKAIRAKDEHHAQQKDTPIRVRIACMAMQGFLAAGNTKIDSAVLATGAYMIADAMIKEGKIQV